jgi:diguanylate cyclase (GGDEF)-like protein
VEEVPRMTPVTGSPTVPAPRQVVPQLDAAALLDAMPDATAVLDTRGVIVAVNRAWRMFAADNNGESATTGVGVSYLDVCARSAASGCEDAAQVLLALQDVLQGGTVEQILDYPCPSPAVGRWFALRITPVSGATEGALVSHSNITRRKAAELDLARRASQDPLTGLANRTAFDQALTRALKPRRQGSTAAGAGVLFLDLDGFKPVNDRYGHAAGDEVLQAVGARLREALLPQDTAARLGGDEFAVVVPRVTSAQLEAIAERLRVHLAAPHVVHSDEVVVSAAVGTSLALPGDSPAEVLARADAAMYVDKRRAPGRERTSG